MLLDERLCLQALADPRALRMSLGVDPARVLAMTWGFHYRLMRAVADPERTGRITRLVTPELRARVGSPPADRVVILDPRPTTALAAEVAHRHGLNLLGADLVAAARHHEAEVALSEGNVGRSWPAAFAAERVTYRVC